MSTQNRPQHYRIRRMVQMVRESTETGYLANSRDFMNEFEVSRRTVARDLDYLRDEENAPLAYDEARHGYVLTDETYALPPVNISRKEAFSFGLARKLVWSRKENHIEVFLCLGGSENGVRQYMVTNLRI